MGVRRGPRGRAGPGMGPGLEPDTAGYFRRALETLQEGLSPEELGGAELPLGGAEPKGKGAEPAVEGAELPPSFPPLLGQLAEAFEEHLPSLLSPPSASLCLQEALQVLHRSQSPACARLCDALIGHLAPPGPAPGDSALVRGLQDPERSRLLEAAVAVSGPRRLRELFRGQLRGRLRGVATHRVANHGLQRLLDHAPDDVVGEVLQELGPALGDALSRGHPGVLTALLGACRRVPALQQEALRCLFQPALGPVTLHGSLLLQHLLHFGDPGPVLGGLEALPPPALTALARSPPGSHVWDALLASPTVPPRARRRLLRKLKGHFVSLACHRNGSRVLDTVWASSSAPARAAIAAELASQRHALHSDPHGRGVARAFAIDLFLRRRGLWERLQAAPARHRGVLGPLLED
ncbi:nucleolar protein 9 isoform X2 [Nyctibius grandis]|uniref:nucleolar protein 9 isoform X2 n=1 Tax=Nyctibius grandis TaxID=48427 RepID=UPI0035BC15DB